MSSEVSNNPLFMLLQYNQWYPCHLIIFWMFVKSVALSLLCSMQVTALRLKTRSQLLIVHYACNPGQHQSLAMVILGDTNPRQSWSKAILGNGRPCHSWVILKWQLKTTAMVILGLSWQPSFPTPLISENYLTTNAYESERQEHYKQGYWISDQEAGCRRLAQTAHVSTGTSLWSVGHSLGQGHDYHILLLLFTTFRQASIIYNYIYCIVIYWTHKSWPRTWLAYHAAAGRHTQLRQTDINYMEILFHQDAI